MNYAPKLTGGPAVCCSGPSAPRMALSSYREVLAACLEQHTAGPPTPEFRPLEADFSPRFIPSPFQARGEISPGKNAILPRTTAGFTLPDTWPQELRGFMPVRPDRHRLLSVLVHRLAVSIRASSPRSVALPQLRFTSFAVASLRGFAPPRLRPCWAHIKKGRKRPRGRTFKE